MGHSPVMCVRIGPGHNRGNSALELVGPALSGSFHHETIIKVHLATSGQWQVIWVCRLAMLAVAKSGFL